MKISVNILIFTPLFVLITMGCRTRPNTQIKPDGIKIVDSIPLIIDKQVYDHSTVYTYYDNNGSIDSVISVYNETGTTEYISYHMKKDLMTREYKYHSDTIHKSCYKNGSIQHLKIYKEVPITGDTLELSFYVNGALERLVIADKDSMDFPQVWKSFHPNGNQYREGKMDHYKTSLVPLGLWKEWDLEGTLIETTYYFNDEPGKLIYSYNHTKTER